MNINAIYMEKKEKLKYLADQYNNDHAMAQLAFYMSPINLHIHATST